MIVLSAIQPFYFPWIGHFGLIANSDICVMLDDVQFSRGWQNRNRLANTDDRIFWITVPVCHAGLGIRVREAKISGSNWLRRHREAARACYASRQGFPIVMSLLDSLSVEAGGSLSALNVESTKRVLTTLGILTDIQMQSDLQPTGRQSTMLLSLCHRFGATKYLSGPAAKAYLDVELFEAEGVSVEWFAPPAICVRPGPTSIDVPLSILDTLAHFGRDATRLLRARW